MMGKYKNTSFLQSLIQREALDTLNNRQEMLQLYQLLHSTFAIADHLNVSQALVSNTLVGHNIPTSRLQSGFQREIHKYISETLNVNCNIDNRTIIAPKEIDIYIPSHDLALECDGIFWHSERFKSKQYHVNKTRECADKGIRLIHIFEHEFVQKKDIVKSRIAGALNKNQSIFARKCEIKKIDRSRASAFYDVNHMQGTCNALSYNYGLFICGEMVAAMSFVKARYGATSRWELVRYCSKLFTNVVGGASRLLKAFLKEMGPVPVVSYCDNRWGTGGMYMAMGFVFSHTTAPNYFYFKDGHSHQLMSRLNFQKHKLAKKLEVFDPNKTEIENMRDNGYERIWDCGSTVWLLG
jgi:very-short-patch-repair endonuclease